MFGGGSGSTSGSATGGVGGGGGGGGALGGPAPFAPRPSFDTLNPDQDIEAFLDMVPYSDDEEGAEPGGGDG